MAFENWKEKRREKELEKVSRELEELKKKGLEFEGKRHSMSAKPEKRESPRKEVVSSSGSFNVLSLIAWILVVLLAIGLLVTFISYRGKVNDITEEKNSIEETLSTKEAELASALEKNDNLTKELEEKGKSETDLADELEAMDELKKILEEDIEDLEEEIAELKTDVQTQKDLVDSYKQCIKDEDDGLNESLSVCDDFL